MSGSPVELGGVIAGKYRVERVLGQGGMGVVVVAMHDELDQRVAIKFLLRDALTDGEWIARFSREAKAAARIKSEHAVKVYDVGKLETGAPYMVMEYLEGRDIQTILNDRRLLPVDEAVEYLLQACEAIAEAHSVGIVHRDLKPANLFVTHRTDGSSCVKILDFGISKMTSLTGTDSQNVTNTTAIVGSPLYMSPEQMRASKNVDRRTDIWSLGVILQELVSGLPSFVANTTAELCAIVLTAPPSPLDVPNAPPGLADVITKCLKKNPEERYASIGELAKALERFGPSSVKTSVERIVRISMGHRTGTPSITTEPSGPVSIVPAGQVAASSLGQTELSASPQAPAAPSAPQLAAEPVMGAGTAAAWGSSRGQSLIRPKMSRLPVVVAAAIVAGIGVLAIAFAVTRPSTPPHTGTDPTTHTPTPTQTQTQTPTPTQTQTSAPVQTETVATATAATTTAAAAVTTHATAHTTATATTKPTSTASTKPPTTAPINTSGFGGRN
jgi:serine/threonine-protein kinase